MGDLQEMQFTIHIQGINNSVKREELATLTRELRSDLLKGTGIKPIPIPQEQHTAQGKKGGYEIITLGALMIAILPKALPEVIKFLSKWLEPHERYLEITIQSEKNRFVTIKSNLKPDEIESCFDKITQNIDKMI